MIYEADAALTPTDPHQILQNLVQYLQQHIAHVKHYKKFESVKAQQAQGGEEIQTMLGGAAETNVRTANRGDWIISNIASQGEQQIVDDKTFRKRYDVQNPKGDIYKPKNADFFGVPYDDGSLGQSLIFAPPNWGGDTQTITKGYMIGGPDPHDFSKDFYGIDPGAFAKTYKPAEQVQD